MKKQEAVKVLTECAELYEKHFIGKNVLFIFQSNSGLQFRETTYNDSNFLHLTGVGTDLSPRDFFYMCKNHKLSLEKFWIPSGGKAELKLRILNDLMHLPFKARMIGHYDCLRLYLRTDLIAGSSYASMGFVGNGKNYSPNTALNEDVRKLVDEAHPILLTYRRDIKDPHYTECTYTSRQITEDQLQEIKEYFLNEYNIFLE